MISFEGTVGGCFLALTRPLSGAWFAMPLQDADAGGPSILSRHRPTCSGGCRLLASPASAPRRLRSWVAAPRRCARGAGGCCSTWRGKAGRGRRVPHLLHAVRAPGLPAAAGGVHDRHRRRGRALADCIERMGRDLPAGAGAESAADLELTVRARGISRAGRVPPANDRSLPGPGRRHRSAPRAECRFGAGTLLGAARRR